MPVGAGQAFGNAVLSADADTVGIEVQSGKDRIRTGSEGRTCAGAANIEASTLGSGADIAAPVCPERRRVRRVVETRIEVRGLLASFVSVRHTIPAQAKVQS